MYHRLSGDSELVEVTDRHRAKVVVNLDRMYSHKVLRINYTSYDIRRSQDCVNPRTSSSDIMVLSADDDHPYWYARVIGIFHVMARYKNEAARQMDFVWVRWFGFDSSHRWGLKVKRLPRVGFLDGNESCAFGFIDPASIIRAVHLLPVFNLGRTTRILSPSIARRKSEKDEDWIRFYVGM